jgi:dephospho-CoA kinase
MHFPVSDAVLGAQSLGSQWITIPSSVASGVLVALVITACRVAWRRRRVPSALTLQVKRSSYLSAVHKESARPGICRLDVYAPGLQPAGDDPAIAQLQDAWAAINRLDGVRVLTLDLEKSLQAGMELLDLGIEVRVLLSGRALGSDGQTCHLFETATAGEAVAIVNDHSGGADRPARITGGPATEPYRDRFRSHWEQARPIESVVTERILRPIAAGGQGKGAVTQAIRQADRTGLHLGPQSTGLILPHLAFRDSCQVVFVLGLPGAGKSYIRARLTERLSGMRIESRSLSDYPYAYLDMLRALLRIQPTAGNGFRAHDGGAFTVSSEKLLANALRMLHADVKEAMQSAEVTVVEFARADLITALHEFDDIRSKSRVIYVKAPCDLRQERLAKRAVPPEIKVCGNAITVSLSDNHLLPSAAERTLYANDNAQVLRESANWRDRICDFDNETDGNTIIEKRLDEFIQSILSPYRQVAASRPGIW